MIIKRRRHPRLILAQALAHTPTHPLLELGRVLAPQPGCLDVGGTLVVGAGQHRDHGEQDGLGGLDGRPALGSRFVAVLVFLGRVEDGDADFAVGID